MAEAKVQLKKGNLSEKEYWSIKIYGIPELVEAGITGPIVLHMPDSDYGMLKNYNVDINKLLQDTIEDELSSL